MKHIKEKEKDFMASIKQDFDREYRQKEEKNAKWRKTSKKERAITIDAHFNEIIHQLQTEDNSIDEKSISELLSTEITLSEAISLNYSNHLCFISQLIQLKKLNYRPIVIKDIADTVERIQDLVLKETRKQIEAVKLRLEASVSDRDRERSREKKRKRLDSITAEEDEFGEKEKSGIKVKNVCR